MAKASVCEDEKAVTCTRRAPRAARRRDGGAPFVVVRSLFDGFVWGGHRHDSRRTIRMPPVCPPLARPAAPASRPTGRHGRSLVSLSHAYMDGRAVESRPIISPRYALTCMPRFLHSLAWQWSAVLQLGGRSFGSPPRPPCSRALGHVSTSVSNHGDADGHRHPYGGGRMSSELPYPPPAAPSAHTLSKSCEAYGCGAPGWW